ncbi:hypothetical protein U0070_003460 [Myodes glareolus]|uniref:C-C motif chemokine n=1 Tax=Myodes glareolus TaxID=447135 RepID=A0AAW0JUG1_MYOGA
MKISAVLLGLLLIAVTVSPGELAKTEHSARPPNSLFIKLFSGVVYVPVTCCYSTAKQIPMRRLKSYRTITSSQCPWEAVIFRTILDREICADPKEKWVENAIKNLDQKSQTQHP